MSQESYTSAELHLILMEMESRHRRNILLCIHEVLNALDAAKPVEERSKSYQRCMQLADGTRPPVEALLSLGLPTARLFHKESP